MLDSSGPFAIAAGLVVAVLFALAYRTAAELRRLHRNPGDAIA